VEEQCNLRAQQPQLAGIKTFSFREFSDDSL
jgi:hypothetical protein